MKFAGKTALLFLMIGTFAASAFIGSFLRRRDKIARRRFCIAHASWWGSAGLRVMGIKTRVVGRPASASFNKNCLIVANHMSYLDVMILASKIPTAFVTSVDMGEIPVLGDIANFCGSIFVERRDRSRIDRDLGAMTEALKNDFVVSIYPEGTSTNGQRILPFKKSLLMSAVDAGREIQPVCLRYLEIDHEPFSPTNCDKVCWYGKMSFMPHLLSVLRLKAVVAELLFLEPISVAGMVNSEEARQEIARRSRGAIDRAYFAGREWLRAPADALALTDQNPKPAMTRA